MNRRTLLIAAGVLTLASNVCFGWSEQGHHIITLIAFDLLTEDEQKQLLNILAEHPRYAEDFTPPKHIDPANHDRWRIGTAGYWPDIARKQPKFNRPTWHYQLGASYIIGDRDDLNIPETPGPLPEEATLETQDLYIAQAIQLCRTVMSDSEQPGSDRAIALCWLAHLVGDAHQPCHAGSLYAEGVFPDGDRGGNSIPVRQGRNLHALWDGLLGRIYDEADIRRRMLEITSDKQLMHHGDAAATKFAGMEPESWLAEGWHFAVSVVYYPDVSNVVTAVSRGLTKELETIDLSERYLRRAGSLAQFRASEAAHRLAVVWREALKSE